ncbi:hypothetical protein [Methylopila sp. 73B]|uniref:hypothetical protein n=1 Tax=Methylopila sp. 73B TaxID=1120792 RepID=UPI0009E0264A|nr:hypothetical protein [Methylopila sp. 73B]
MNFGHCFALLSQYPAVYQTEGLKGGELEVMQQLKRRMRADWIEDLADVPEWAVRHACREWRRSSKGEWRPKISDILHLANSALAPFRAQLLDGERKLDHARLEARRQAHFAAEHARVYG